MSYMSIRLSRLKAQLTAVQNALNNLYAQQLELSTSNVESYAFDSGEGSQRTTRRKLSEIQDQIDRLEAKEMHLINEIYNMGLVRIQTRRKNPIC